MRFMRILAFHTDCCGKDLGSRIGEPEISYASRVLIVVYLPTFSMMGCELAVAPIRTTTLILTFYIDGADKGIIPLTCSELFVRVAQKTESDPNTHFTVEVSYIEVRGLCSWRRHRP
jgi:hypothetical protein